MAKKQRPIPLLPIIGVFIVIAGIVIGTGLYVESKQPNTACTSHAPSSQPPLLLLTPDDYFAQGNYEYDRGSCGQAIANYSQAILLRPGFAEAYNNRAYTYMMQNDYADALPDLDHAIALRPDYVHALMNRGDIYNYDYQINRAKALADYDRVIALGPAAINSTSVCGHRILAVSNGWNFGTVFRILTQLRSVNCGK